MQSHCSLFSHKDSEASIRPRIRLVRWDPTLPTGQLNWDSNLKPHFVTLALYQLSHLIPWQSLNSATCYPDSLWTQLPVTLTLFELSYLLPWQSLNSVTFYPDTLWTQLPFTLALFELSYLLPWQSLNSATCYPDTLWTQLPVTLTVFELSYLLPWHSLNSVTFYPGTLWTQLPFTLALFEISYLLPWHCLNSVTCYPDTFWTQLFVTWTLCQLWLTLRNARLSMWRLCVLNGNHSRQASRSCLAWCWAPPGDLPWLPQGQVELWLLDCWGSHWVCLRRNGRVAQGRRCLIQSGLSAGPAGATLVR